MQSVVQRSSGMNRINSLTDLAEARKPKESKYIVCSSREPQRKASTLLPVLSHQLIWELLVPFDRSPNKPRIHASTHPRIHPSIHPFIDPSIVFLTLPADQPSPLFSSCFWLGSASDPHRPHTLTHYYPFFFLSFLLSISVIEDIPYNTKKITEQNKNGIVWRTLLFGRYERDLRRGFREDHSSFCC